MCHVLDNVEDMKKILFPIQKYICCGYTFGKMYQCSFPKNPTHSSEPLEMIHSNLLELPTLSYSMYKWIITFLDDYSSFITLLFCTKSLRLQMQLSPFLRCGQTLLPILKRGCILIMGENKRTNSCIKVNTRELNRELFTKWSTLYTSIDGLC